MPRTRDTRITGYEPLLAPAALLKGLVKAPAGSKVACVLSGGNVNLDQLRGLKWN